MIAINSVLVDRGEWHARIVRPGDVIEIRSILQGGDQSNPIATVFSIALLAVAPQLGLSLVAQNLLVFAGMYAINALFPPPTPDMSALSDSAAKDSPTYSISGGQNRVRIGQPMPIMFGTHRMVPDLGALPYTRYSALVTNTLIESSQYLFQVFNFGLSDITLSSIKIGNTPINKFADVSIEQSGIDGGINQYFFSNVNTAGFNVDLSEPGDWVVRTTDLNTIRVEVDISAVIFQINSSGRVVDNRVTIEVEWRAVGGTTWFTYFGFGSAYELEAGEYDSNYRISLARGFTAGQYQIRVRRTSPKETDSNKRSDVAWVGLKSYQPDTADYNGQKRLAVSIRASGQLNGVIDQLNAVASAQLIIPQVGGGSITAPTSNPAWCFYNFAVGRADANGRRIWGCRLSDSRIDIDALFEWADFCDENDLKCDLVIDRAMNCQDALRIIAQCGRGTPSWASGKLGVVWDAPDQPVTAVFGMGNIRAGSFIVEYISQQLAEEMVGVFLNRDQGYALDEVRVLAPGITTPATSARLELMGITRETQAARAMNLLMARNEYQRRRITWETDIEGLTCTRGDVVILSHDMTSWGFSGRIQSGTNGELILDRPVSFTPSEDHFLLYIEPNGAMSLHPVTYQAGPSDTITITNGLDDILNSDGETPVAPDDDTDHPSLDYQYAFAPLATPGKKVKIIEIKPVGPRHVRLVAVDEDPDYYAAENGDWEHTSPPAFIGRIPTVEPITISEQLLSSDGLVRLFVRWQLDGSDSAMLEVNLGNGFQNYGRIFGQEYTITVRTGAQVIIRVRPYAFTNLQEIETAEVSYTVLGKFYPPPDVPWFTIDGTTVRWAEVAQGSFVLAGYQIRYRSGDNRQWIGAQPLHTGLLQSSPFTFDSLPSGTNTIMIKPIDASGNEAENAAVILTNLGDRLASNIILTIDHHAEAFPWTITNGTVNVITGDLEADPSTRFYSGEDTDPFYPLDLDAPFYPSQQYAQMEYVFRYDVDPLDQGAAISLEYDIEGIFTIFFRPYFPDQFYSGIDSAPVFTGDDSALVYGSEADWIPWPGVLVASSITYEFRILTAAGAQQGIISQLQMHIDVEDVVDYIADISIVSGGTRLTLNKSFRRILTVSPTLQHDGGSAITAKTIDKDVDQGPLVKCFNSSNVATSGLIDAIVKGY
jgi:hypothetical protein